MTCIVKFVALLLGLYIMIVSCANSTIYKVYYIPFGVRFYGAVEADRIENVAFYAFNIDSKNIDKLYETVSSKSTERSEADALLDLRVKLIRVSDGKVIFIDSTKNIISDDQIFIVDKATVNEVVRDMATKANDTGCRQEIAVICGVDVEAEVNY